MDTEVEIHKIYVIKDIKANLFSPPVTFETDEAFQQYLSVVINTHGSGHYHLYPEDFVGFYVGNYFPETGTFDLYEKEIIVSLAGLKKSCPVCTQMENFTNEQSIEIQ